MRVIWQQQTPGAAASARSMQQQAEQQAERHASRVLELQRQLDEAVRYFSPSKPTSACA